MVHGVLPRDASFGRTGTLATHKLPQANSRLSSGLNPLLLGRILDVITPLSSATVV
jgi:hypothetical protein